MTIPTQQVLIATLGTEPQVVTVTLDILVERGNRFEDVIVFRTSTEQFQIRDAVRILDEALQRQKAARVIADYRFIELKADGKPLKDIYSEADANAVFGAIWSAVRAEKQQSRVVHLNAAGGRKGMMIFAMAVAQILFDANDHLWLLSSSEEFFQSRALHRRTEADAHLIPIPVLLWSDIPPVLTTLIVKDDPIEAIRAQKNLVQVRDRLLKKEFLEKDLTMDERELVELLVRESGLTNVQLGRRLNCSPKTVAKNLTFVYDKVRYKFALRSNMTMTREVLISLYASYFEWIDQQTGKQ